MKWKDIFVCGLQDLKSQRRKNRTFFLMIFLSIVSYIGVNSTIDGIKNGIYDSKNGYFNRMLAVHTNDGTWEEKYEYLSNKYGEDDRVDEIVVGSMWFDYFQWRNVKDIFGVENVNIAMSTFYKAVLTNDYKGEKREPKEDEIILPRYIYNKGVYDEYTCYNTDELIGQNISVFMDPFELGKTSYEFRVIGTYDNVTDSVTEHFFLNSNVMKKIVDIYYEQQYMWREKMIEEHGAGANPKKEGYGIYLVIKEGYDIDEIYDEFFNDVFEETNESVPLSRVVTRSEEVTGYYNYIRVIGNIVAFLFLFVAILNIIISAISEVKQRNWEFSLKMSMGYTKKDIIKIFSVEKLINATKAVGYSLIVLVIYSNVLTYYYRNLEVYWKRSCMITIEFVDVIVCILLVTLASFMGIVVADFMIGNIDISNTLKKGE